MQTSNQHNRAIRQERVGHVWTELLAGAQGAIPAPGILEFSTIRVRATGATTVTINGVLAMTMSAGEIEYFNVGRALEGANGYCSVVIGGANAFVQVAKQN